jgi:Tol biopolymer transport system component
MRKTLLAKYIASEIHALLFICMWVLYSVFSQPLMDGLSVLPFVILFIADLPISLIAFGVMFTNSKLGTVAAVLWGVLGTLWWFAIGSAIDAWVRHYRMKLAAQTEQTQVTATPNFAANILRRRELALAAIVVAIVIVCSFAWQWNGRQGHFEKGKIGNFAFAPDGGSIVLVRSQGDSSRIEKVVLNSGKSSPIGQALQCMASAPTYSPDGARIAIVCESRPTGLSGILIMDADGGDLHPLFSSNSDNYDFAAHFTPDGMEVYFGRLPSFVKDTGSGGAPSRRWDVYSASIDGKDERPLTDRHFEDFGMSFSADGRKFLLAGDSASGTRLHLYSLDDSGKSETTIQPLIPNGARTPEFSDVVLSSDGRSIYFMAASEGKNAFDYDVYRLDLTSNALEKFTASNGYATDLCVSSDGKTAVFLRWTSRWGSFPNLARLYTLDLATKRLTALNVTGTR